MNSKSSTSISKQPQHTVQFERKQLLREFHTTIHKKTLYFAAPVVMAVYGASLIGDVSIQNIILFVAVCAVCVGWLVGYLMPKLSLNTTVFLFGVPILVLACVELMVIQGTETSTIMTAMAACIYMSMYSKRHLIFSGSTLGVSVILSELYKGLYARQTLVLWPLKTPEATERMFTQIIFGILVCVLTVLILEKMRNINNRLLKNVATQNRQRESILLTVNQIEPIIQEASTQIANISNNFVAQASRQAAAITELNTTMTAIGRGASDSTSSATRAFNLSTQLQQNARNGVQKLKTVETGLKNVTQSITQTKERLVSLGEMTENIEAILGYNREIAENIKVLAVNASIEAASAGQFGLGFNVVAQELRELIDRTEANLQKSAKFLTSIRKDTEQSCYDIQKDAENLRLQYEHMIESAEIMDRISGSFTIHSEEVGNIAHSASRQGANISQVTVAIEQLQNDAESLEIASRNLFSTVDQINQSHRSLQSALHIH